VTSPDTDIARVADAHARLLAAIEGLTDDQVHQASLLPDWTVAHVLTHLARNADSHVRRVAGALRGEFVEQYAGGVEGRAADIEAGARRSAAALVADVRQTAHAVDDAWRDLPDATWDARSRDVGGRDRALRELPSRRWQEIEVHLVDLGIGVTHRDWPDEFVAEWLPRMRRHFQPDLPPDADTLPFDDPRDELAWLYGRLHRSDLPQLPSWG
jgi:maleylpyruvate isomerase